MTIYCLLLAHVDEHSLLIRIHPQRINRILPTNTRSLGAAKRRRQEGHADGIDSNHTGIDVGGEAQRLVDVLREDTRHEAVVRVVGLLDDLFLRLELVEDGDGAEDLVLGDLGVVGRVLEDGGLYEEALVIVR
jgi:hypothetical protein